MGKTTNVPARLHSVEVGNILTGADEILDDNKNKKQSTINQETDQTLSEQEDRIINLEQSVGRGGTVDQKISQAKSEIIGDAGSNYNTLGKIEDKLQEEVSRATDSEELLRAAYEALAESDPEVIRPTDTWPVANPEGNVIYRVVDRVNTPPQYYSDFMWNGSSMVEMARYNNAIDEKPTADSANLVESGGVYAVARILASKVNGFYIDTDHLIEVSSGTFRYIQHNDWDCIWVPISDGSKKIEITGVSSATYRFFSSFETLDSTTFVGKNSTGVIPDGSVLCLYNQRKSSNPDGYGNLSILQDNYNITRNDFEGLYNKLTEDAFDEAFIIPLGKNMFDKDDCLYGKIIDGGVLADDEKGIMSNKIRLDEGETYTIQNAICYGNSHKIFIALFDSNELYLGYMSVSTSETTSNIYTSATFTYNPNITGVSYCRVVLQTTYSYNVAPINLALTQLEVGSTATSVEPFEGKLEYSPLFDNYPSPRSSAPVKSNGIWEKIAELSIDEKRLDNGTPFIINNALFSIEGSPVAGYLQLNDLWDCAIVKIIEGSTTITLDNPDNNDYQPKKRFFGYLDFSPSAQIPQLHTNSSKTANVNTGDKYCILNFRKSDNPNGIGNIKITQDNYYLKKKDNIGLKKTIKLLSIGNSYSDDALAYVPFILQNMAIDAEIQIGILMRSSASIQDHVNNFENEESVYGWRFYNGGNSWTVEPEGTNGVSIQWALDNYEWDIISLQQSSQGSFNWSSYQPWCNKLINLIGAYVDYNIKFIWYQPQARPASSNSGANWSDETITEHYESTAEASEKIFNETVCEAVVPVGTAIQNARTIAALKALGAYANNPSNTSGLGYLTPNDGVHLQEGLPCQIAAYTFICVLLKLCGLENVSIIGETTRVTAEWVSGKNIPSPHGDCIGSTDANCLMAQKCVIMAVKHPFEATDMNYIINPT